MKNSFFLVIPSQQKNAERLKLYQEEVLRQWIIDLPVANPGLATRLFHDFIKDFNKTEMDVQLRLDTLETLKPSFLDIEDYLRARLAKAGFPKGENEQKILEVVVSIEKEFALGYWIAVRELTRRTISWFQGKNTALAIQRCIKGLGNIVVTHYMMCLPVPEWVWLDLHSLYSLSVKVGKENAKVPEDLDKPSRTNTPEESYTQVLLLSLTEPAGLMQKEVQQLYSFLGKYGYLAKLEKKPVGAQMIQCSVLIDEDCAPVFERNEHHTESNKLYINFVELYKALAQRDKMVSDKEGRFSTISNTRGTVDRLPSELIDYLEQRWLGTELHGMPCFEDRLDRYFAIGLESTHELLQNAEEKTEQSELEYFAQSSSERALSCRFSKEGVIAIGSLVSFRKVNISQNKRTLGVVSKIIMPKQKNTSLDFEVQIISTEIDAVDYILPNAAEDDPIQKALFYANKEADDKKYIIVDSFLLKEGDTIKLFMPAQQEESKVVLKNKKNVGVGYWQFECKRVIEPKKAPEKPAKAPMEEKKGYDFI